MALLLALCRQVPRADAALRGGGWARSGSMGVQLYRKTLGIVGLGRVGGALGAPGTGFCHDGPGLRPLHRRGCGARAEGNAGRPGRVPHYANLLSCRVVWDGGERLVSGSLLGHESPRVVQIGGFRIDAQPEGIVLVMENVDVPGVIRRMGTLLGAHAINIAEWRLGRAAPGGQALSFINLDSPAAPEVLAGLVQLEGVTRVRQVRL